MIDIIDDMVRIAGTIVDGRSYRVYPMIHLVDVPFIVVSHQGRTVLETTDRGSELVTSLNYNVDIFAHSIEECDDLSTRLTNLYNSKNIQSTGYSQSYETGHELYVATLSYSVTVDVRGHTYR